MRIFTITGPAFPPTRKGLYFDLRTKREKELREKVYLEIKKDKWFGKKRL